MVYFIHAVSSYAQIAIRPFHLARSHSHALNLIVVLSGLSANSPIQLNYRNWKWACRPLLCLHSLSQLIWASSRSLSRNASLVATILAKHFQTPSTVRVICVTARNGGHNLIDDDRRGMYTAQSIKRAHTRHQSLAHLCALYNTRLMQEKRKQKSN